MNVTYRQFIIFLKFNLKIFQGHEFFWTSGDVTSAFQSQSAQPYSYLAKVYMFPEIYAWCDICCPLNN